MIHLPFQLSTYQNRRAALARHIGPNAVALIPTAVQHPRNRDNDHPYRADSYFLYLCGFTEPDAWLVLEGSGRCTLFCQPKDETREIWDGRRLGPEAAPAALGVDAALSVEALDVQLPALLDGKSAVWLPFATHPGLEARVAAWLTNLRARVRYGALCPTQLSDLCAPLDELRLIKDADEIALMQSAGRISALAHQRAMRTCAQRLRQGLPVCEYHLEAELLHTFRHHGAQSPAYGSIVAAGANACILHYRADRAAVHAGELVLIDAACELDGYASDITRTFPANGRFSGPQRALYDLVLAAQQAAASATRAGARFTDPHDAAVRVLTLGLLDLRLLDPAQVGGLDDAIAQRAYFPFYMHRTGHWLGLDVHDCGAYTEPSELGQTSTRRDALSGETLVNRPARILQPGMVLTLEPGLYVRPSAGVPEAYWNIGIRIEDDAVVTPEGCTLLSRDVPVEADAIEALMAD